MMNQRKLKMLQIVTLTLISCLIMAFVEVVIEPGYPVKSALKVLFFFFVPRLCLGRRERRKLRNAFSLNKKSVKSLLILGLIIYFGILGAYFLTSSFFDYSVLVSSLLSDQSLGAEHFIWVALYISFCNSLLEEFMFRFVAFLKLAECSSKAFAYLFSSIMFALYHIGMIGGSFPLPLLLVALLGLAVGGAIFNFVDDKAKTIYPSWIVHMFADFAIMTVGFLHL